MRQRIKDLKQYGFNTDYRTYIVAEIGINHGGDPAVGKKLIDAAVRAGVDAVKFQTYLTEKRAPEGNAEVFALLKKHELPFEAFKVLKQYTEQQGTAFFSTPFDRESVNYLESIGCSMYKVASFDVVNRRLLSDVAHTGKPVLLSVGMASHEEIEAAYAVLRAGTDKVALLHCISAYPTREDAANLAAIFTLQDAFDCVIGHSDHTPDIHVPLYAAAAGAQVIEKHFKLDDNMECIDAPVSITEEQMRCMVAEVRRLERLFGRGELGVREVEKDITIFRRFSEK